MAFLEPRCGWVRSLRTSHGRSPLAIGSAALFFAVAATVAACTGRLRLGGSSAGEVAVQVLAINDLHGHLASMTPGAIQAGCCEPVRDAGGAQIGWMTRSLKAGGAEYLATHLFRLRHGHAHSFTVSAGDLIGASPLVSALFHDEPTIDVSRAIGLQLSVVGNHELDEGLPELLRLQDGDRRIDTGCHPVDGCQGGTTYAGAAFRYLSANLVDAGSGRAVFPTSDVRLVEGVRLAFVGLTLHEAPTLVAPSALSGLAFRPEAEAANAVIERLAREQGVGAFVVLLHQGGAQAASRPVFPGPSEQPDAYVDVNGCANFRGPEVEAIVRALDARARVVVTGHTHEPYVCTIDGRLVTSAASFGRVVTDIDVRIDRASGLVTRASARNHIVTQDVPKDVAVSSILAKYTALVGPRAQRVVGRLRADIRSARDQPTGVNAAGEQPMADLVADAMLEAVSTVSTVARPAAVAAFMNPGGVRAGLLVERGTGHNAPGDVTYEDAFAVQPFGDVLVVMRCSGRALYHALEQQFDNPSVGARRILAVSDTVRYAWSASARPRVAEGSLTIAGTPVSEASDYWVVVNDFLMSGGDGFTAFRDECADPVGGPTDIAALIAYLQAHAPTAPPAMGRIERIE